MLTLSDAFPSSYPTDHNPKHLDLHSLKELPDSYAWSQGEKTSTSSCGQESVPVIDLNDPNAIKLVGHACKTWGVFQITNHGIPDDLLHDIECAEKELFTLPLQQKLKASRPPDGVSGYGVARISSFFRKLMWSEGFTIVGPPLQHACQLWPQQDYGMTFCHVIENYQKGMKQLAGRLMWLMLCSLGIDNKVDIKWAGPKQDFSGACDVIQLNHYPACPDPDRAMGLAAHTDSSLLTILHQNDTNGLQVLREGIGWILVPPISGALVINVGDLFHILSNGLYPSVLHRVVVNRTKHRFSVAYLYGPPSSVEISPLPNLTGPTHPPLFRPVTWNEYLNTKGKHFNKALSWVRVRVPINGLLSVKDNCVKIS